MNPTIKRLIDRIRSEAPDLHGCDAIAYRDHVMRQGPKVIVPEFAKDDHKAKQLRLEGNTLLRQGKEHAALDKYIESVCWATNDSMEKGMGYANYSNVMYQAGEYEFALMAIALAKRYHFPEQWMPQLMECESNCRQKLAGGHSRILPESSMLTLNVAANPKIPFLADGISMKVLPGYGRSMVTDREFRLGDVILDEEIVSCAVNSRKYSLCHSCTSTGTGSSVPCPKCASVVYCNEECREAGSKTAHRFECGICERLDHISHGASRIAVRMFLRGLDLFNDNVDDMMTFCQTHEEFETNPLMLDFTDGDQLREFKAFHQTLVPSIVLNNDATRAHAALYYSILIEHPPIKALFVRDDQKDFMLNCIHQYLRKASFLASYQVNQESTQLYTVAAICNHSCIPNTFAVASDNRIQFVLLRPVRQNEQILTSYNIMYAANDMGQMLTKTNLTFKCICPICKPAELRLSKSSAPLPIPRAHLEQQRMHGMAANLEDALRGVRQFMQMYGLLHPDYAAFDTFIRFYREGLTKAFLAHIYNKRRIQAGALVANQ